MNLLIITEYTEHENIPKFNENIPGYLEWKSDVSVFFGFQESLVCKSRQFSDSLLSIRS